MTEGFAAHLIMTPEARFKSAIALVDEAGVLKEVRSLDRETPFTRFYDGALLILRHDATPSDPGCAPGMGDRISVWQIYPFNLQAGCPLENTRTLRIR